MSKETKTMSEHKATIKWQFEEGDFLKGRYSRQHTWIFDGGVVVPASASPAVVPAPYSNPADVDPEEAYVASLSSCHMLTYLYVAQRKKYEVEAYEDEAVGTVTKNERGVPWVSAVVLNPRVRYRGNAPSREEEEQLHHTAHEQCFISNSVRTEVSVKLPEAPASV
jgi:organic hydroperoxide reductase OsmC/OhrA